MAKNEFSNMTHEQCVENGRKGGIKSGETKRRKKAQQEILDTLLSLAIKKGKTVDIDNVKSLEALKGKNMTVNEKLMLNVVVKALSGDLNAVQFITNMIGEKPAEKVEVDNVNPLKELSTEELRNLANSINNTTD